MAKTATKPMAVAFPQAVRKFVEAQTESPDEYLGRLVREDRNRRRAELEAHLMKALEEEPVPISEEELTSDENILAIAGRELAAKSQPDGHTHS
jgi:hypothetical protein